MSRRRSGRNIPVPQIGTTFAVHGTCPRSAFLAAKNQSPDSGGLFFCFIVQSQIQYSGSTMVDGRLAVILLVQLDNGTMPQWTGGASIRAWQLAAAAVCCSGSLPLLCRGSNLDHLENGSTAKSKILCLVTEEWKDPIMPSKSVSQEVM